MTTPTPRTDVYETKRFQRQEDQAAFDQLRRDLAAAKSDIQAYRGCLGYPVPGDHDGRLSDGTLPTNGIAEAMHQQLIAAQEARQRAEAERDALLLLARKMGFEGKLTVWTEAIAGEKP